MHAELKNIGFVSQLDFAKMKWEEVKADPKVTMHVSSTHIIAEVASKPCLLLASVAKQCLLAKQLVCVCSEGEPKSWRLGLRCSRTTTQRRRSCDCLDVFQTWHLPSSICAQTCWLAKALLCPSATLLDKYSVSQAQSTNLSRKHKAAQSAGGRWVDAAERQLCDVAHRLLGPYAPPNMEPEHQTRASDPRF